MYHKRVLRSPQVTEFVPVEIAPVNGKTEALPDCDVFTLIEFTLDEVLVISNVFDGVVLLFPV